MCVSQFTCVIWGKENYFTPVMKALERDFSKEGKNKTDKNPVFCLGRQMCLWEPGITRCWLFCGVSSVRTHTHCLGAHTCVCKHKGDCSVCVFLYGQEMLVFCLQEQGARHMELPPPWCAPHTRSPSVEGGRRQAFFPMGE